MTRGLEPFESCLMRLDAIASKCAVLGRDSWHRLESEHEDQIARSILHESMILHAYHFIKVRKDMLCNARFRKIDNIAKPLVSVAIKHESAINKVRDTYVAHAQEKGRFQRTHLDAFAEHGTPVGHADWVFLMQGIRAYGRCVSHIFGAELEAARKKYQATLRRKTKRSETPLTQEGLDKILSSVEAELKRAGFGTMAETSYTVLKIID